MNSPDAEFFDDPELIYMTSVIGRFPECIAAAAKFNLNTLVTSERLWRFTNVSGDPGAMSRAFWRQTARAKHGILLASNPALASRISLYGTDLKLLKELGYVSDSTGTRLRSKHDSPHQIRRVPLPRKAGPVKGFLRKLFRANFAARMRRALAPTGSDQNFEEKIRADFRIVFKDQSARVVSNEKFPKAFGNAIVIISTNSLNLRIIRDRDEFWFDIAPAHVPNEWRPLHVVLGYVKDIGSGHLPSCISLRHVGALLESRLDFINEALSPERFATTKAAVDDAEAILLKAWVKEFSN